MGKYLISEEKIVAIANNIRLRTGETALLTLDEIAEAILTIGGDVDIAEWVHNAVGTTFCPKQVGGESNVEGYDIDIVNATANDVYAYIDEVANNYPNYATKEFVGLDASGKYDVARYILANRQSFAWQKKNYPKMYAWESGGTEGTPDETVVVPAKASVILGHRYSNSGQKFNTSTDHSVVIVPLPKNIESGDSLVIDITTVTQSTTYSVYSGTVNNAFTGSPKYTNNGTTLTFNTSVAGIVGMNFLCLPIKQTTIDSSAVITVNGVTIDWSIDTTTNITASQESTTVIPGTPGIPGETVYSTSISPRIGDALYTTPYIGTAKGNVTSVSATNRSRTIGNIEYVRYADGDVEPTVIYTDVDDLRNNSDSITQNSVTYNRYPLGDLGKNGIKLTPIFIYANEHGNDKTYTTENIAPASGSGQEGKLPSLVASRFIRDLCTNASAGNAFYNYLRNYCMIIIIPVANPWGYNFNVSSDTASWSGYLNANHVNINRNYDTPGWDVSSQEEGVYSFGAYAGSENETQYIMNTIVESGAAVAISLHGMWGWQGYVAHQGQQPDGSDFNQEKLTKVYDFLLDNYGYKLRYYDSQPCQNLPATTSKSPSYITQSGAYGAIVEFTEDDVRTSAFERDINGYVVENAYCQMLNLMAMWLSDYLESI